MKQTKLGPTQQKILLLLMAGVAMGLTRSANVQLRVMKDLGKEWQKINRHTLTRSVTKLYTSKLVRKMVHPDGTTTLILTDAGKRRVLRYNLETMKVKTPKRWDGLWRIVMYDIPEEKRDLRIELLGILKRLGFYELQHSVFIHPYECKNEIEYLIEAFDAREYIRRIRVDDIDSPEPLLDHFQLIKK